MYDLDEILDDVREKYYCSKMFPRPTISWSDEYWTETFGQYNLFNNHITVSRVLNNPKVSYDALASVVYHESIHQDFGEHDRKFTLRANKFPNYKKCFEELQLFFEDYLNTFEYNEKINDFEDYKQKVCYILLPKSEDIIDAFKFYNNNIYINAKIKNCENVCGESHNYLFIFLLEKGENYHIVGWSNEAILLPKNKKTLHSRFGGLDLQYQLYARREDMYILFNSTCWYTIKKNLLPDKLRKEKYFIEDILNEGVQEDISFINSYCEGFNDIGIDDNVINIAAPVCNITYNELLKIAKKECGFRGIWMANALCNMKENFETVFNKADAKRDSCLINSAYEDMKKALEYSPNNQICIIELIKICAMLDDFEFGNTLIDMLSDKGSIKEDKCLKESIVYLNNVSS